MTRSRLPSILRARLPTKQGGVALIEIVLVMATLTMLASVFMTALVGSEDTTRLSGSRVRASGVAEEGLEAVRNIRDKDFANLTDGPHGLALVGGSWQFSGTSDVIDGYTRIVTVSTIDADTKNVVANVTWQQNAERTGSTQLSQRFTNWHAVDVNNAQYLTLDFSQASLSGDNKEIRNALFMNASSSPITIVSMKFTWNVSGAQIERIRLSGTTVWSKVGPGTPLPAQNSGTPINIVDYVLPANANTYMDNLKFTKSMDDATVTMEVTLLDGSVYSVTHTFSD